jgi:hypothetical protein
LKNQTKNRGKGMKNSIGSMEFSKVRALIDLVNPGTAREILALVELALEGQRAIVVLEGIRKEFGIDVFGGKSVVRKKRSLRVSRQPLPGAKKFGSSDYEKSDRILNLLRARRDGDAAFQKELDKVYPELGLQSDPSREHRVRIMMARTQGKYRGQFVLRLIDGWEYLGLRHAAINDNMAEFAGLCSIPGKERVTVAQLWEEADKARVSRSKRRRTQSARGPKAKG